MRYLRTCIIFLSLASCVSELAPVNRSVQKPRVITRAPALKPVTADGSGGKSESAPSSHFEPSKLPDLEPAPGIGVFAKLNEASEREEGITRLFQRAYLDALYCGIELIGTLGGDFVHPWPGSEYPIMVQNWRSSTGTTNSWGLPNLVLAMYHLDHDQVFLVMGAFLDAYGQSEGIDGSNGPEGYGYPLSNGYVTPEGRAQRFSKGRLLITSDGHRSFSLQTPPSQAYELDPLVGHRDASDPVIRSLFQAAWRRALDMDLPLYPSDSPVLDLSVAGLSLYIQTFGSESWALVAYGSDPEKAYIVEGRGLRAYLDNRESFGPPCSDPFIHQGENAQRFTQGFLYYKR